MIIHTKNCTPCYNKNIGIVYFCFYPLLYYLLVLFDLILAGAARLFSFWPAFSEEMNESVENYVERVETLFSLQKYYKK